MSLISPKNNSGLRDFYHDSVIRGVKKVDDHWYRKTIKKTGKAAVQIYAQLS